MAICCGVAGYCYNGVCENEATSTNPEKDINGLPMSVILNKITTIDEPQEYCFYFNIFFQKFWFDEKSTRIVRYNRMNKCPIKTDKEIKKEVCWTFECRYDEINGILGLVWEDNNYIKMLLNYMNVLPFWRMTRSRSEKKQALIPQHTVILNFGAEKHD